MSLLNTIVIQCPYCGESIEVVVDASVAQQIYIEDCSVCCQPINLTIDASNPDDIGVIALSDNE